jgi:hypothetical protein
MSCPLNPYSFSVLGGSLLCRHHGFHCSNRSSDSAKPRRPHKCPTASAIATRRFVRWIRPASTRQQCFLQRCQSSVNPICQFCCHLIRGLPRGIGQTVDLVLSTNIKDCLSREGTPGQVRGASEMGATLHHGVATSFVATCTPALRFTPAQQ